MKGGDGGVVEQAEAHGLIGFRVVAGRPDGAERVPGLALHHLIDGLDVASPPSAYASPSPSAT